MAVAGVGGQYRRAQPHTLKPVVALETAVGRGRGQESGGAQSVYVGPDS